MSDEYQRVAGGCSWLGRSLGLRVIEASAQQVRKVLAGKSNADDRDVQRVVESNVFGAAAASNSRARDAAAIGLLAGWILAGRAVLPAPPPPKPKKSRAPKAVTA
jgi:Holliday junction resolvasome RuvABC endonuclease subunit